MERLRAFLLWTVVFLLLLAGIDQFLLRVPARHPVHAAIAAFHRELRGRVLSLGRDGMAGQRLPLPPVAPRAADAPPGIEALIEQRRAQSGTPAPISPSTPAEPGARPAAPGGLRYLYTDQQGALHFAETLAEIPAPLRDTARALGE